MNLFGNYSYLCGSIPSLSTRWLESNLICPTLVGGADFYLGGRGLLLTRSDFDLLNFGRCIGAQPVFGRHRRFLPVFIPSFINSTSSYKPKPYTPYTPYTPRYTPSSTTYSPSTPSTTTTTSTTAPTRPANIPPEKPVMTTPKPVQDFIAKYQTNITANIERHGSEDLVALTLKGKIADSSAFLNELKSLLADGSNKLVVAVGDIRFTNVSSIKPEGAVDYNDSSDGLTKGIIDGFTAYASKTISTDSGELTIGTLKFSESKEFKINKDDAKDKHYYVNMSREDGEKTIKEKLTGENDDEEVWIYIEYELAGKFYKRWFEIGTDQEKNKVEYTDAVLNVLTSGKAIINTATAYHNHPMQAGAKHLQDPSVADFTSAGDFKTKWQMLDSRVITSEGAYVINEDATDKRYFIYPPLTATSPPAPAPTALANSTPATSTSVSNKSARRFVKDFKIGAIGSKINLVVSQRNVLGVNYDEIEISLKDPRDGLEDKDITKLTSRARTLLRDNNNVRINIGGKMLSQNDALNSGGYPIRPAFLNALKKK